MAVAGDAQRALDIARMVTVPFRRAEAIAAVAAELARRGDHDEAADAIGQIDSPVFRPAALACLACAPARAGRGTEAAGTAREAEDAAHAVGDAVGRAAALASAAEALARSGETDRARRAVVEACVDGHWHDALLPALLADPDAAGRVVWYLGIRASDDGTATAN